MQIGELFLNLGIKGIEKTADGLNAAVKGLRSTASTSLETKAALVGVFYAFEKLLSASAQTGNSITNFTSALGMQADTLQRYQEVARDTGSSNEEMLQTFKALQDAMVKTYTGGGQPTGLMQVLQATRDMGPFSPTRAAEHPEELLQRIQAYLQREKNVGFANQQAASFGLSPTMIALLRRGVFTPDRLKATTPFSDAQIKQLEKVYEKWSKLETKITKAFGDFNAKHGEEITNGLSEIVGQVVELAEAMDSFAKKIHLFDLLKMSLKGVAQIFGGLTEAVELFTTTADAFSDDPKKRAKARAQLKDMLDTIEYDFGNVFETISRESAEERERAAKAAEDYKNKQGKPAGQIVEEAAEELGLTPKKKKAAAELPPQAGPRNLEGLPQVHAPKGAIPHLMLVPPPPVTKPAAAASTHTTEINQTFQFSHDGRNAQQVGTEAGRGTKSALRQLPSLTQSN